MKTKLEKRAKNKRSFVILSVIWIILTIFFHIIYVMNSSGNGYWPIYPIMGIAIPVAIMAGIVFIDEFEAKKEEEQSLIKKGYAPDLNNAFSSNENNRSEKEMLTINYNRSDLV